MAADEEGYPTSAGTYLSAGLPRQSKHAWSCLIILSSERAFALDRPGRYNVASTGVVFMGASSANRRLAAILAADIAGYSRLVAEDEGSALSTLGTYRSAIADIVVEHGGRIF